MVAPTSGPFNTSVATNSYYLDKRKYKQAKPIDRPLPYFMRTARVVKNTGNFIPYAGYAAVYGPSASELNQMNSACYEKLKGKLYGTAGVGVTLVEYQQSLTMVESRALQLWRFGRKLSRFDFPGAAKELRTSIPKGVSKKKSFANNYLEFHFGWAPLLGDIHDAVKVLGSPVKAQKVSASTRMSCYYKDTSRVPPSLLDWTAMGFYKMGCEVSVSNPNILVANQLGLLNPIVLINERIPFSFIADWVSNWSQFLSLGTDFLGLSVTNAWTVYGYTKGLYREYNPYGGVEYSCANMFRTVGLTLPSLTLKPYKAPSWTRAATAISLLLQQLK